MRLHVKLFGSLAQQAGARAVDIDLSDGAMGSDLVRCVAHRFPETAAVLERSSLAVNLHVLPWTTRLRESDEVALLPPASGGESISVTVSDRVSVHEAVAAVSVPAAGGIAVFIGTVRDNSDAGSVDRLEYSAYDAMADKVLREIAMEATSKWGLHGVAVQHAVGVLDIGSPTMVVACAAAHRDEAFDACRYVVDELKRRVPIWKKEFGPWGERWIEH
jgi:molybdopterin synthase catalytic subunit